MTDREMLESAAKAADYEVKPHVNHRVASDLLFTLHGKNWNPLTDDGDALRLAVKLEMEVAQSHTKPLDPTGKCNLAIAGVMVGRRYTDFGASYSECNGDANAATRRAIVRAAAAIGNAA